MKYLLTFLFIAILASCTMENVNEKRFAGVWLGTKVQYITYQDNAIISDSTVANSGAMFLYDDDELENQISYSLLIPPPFTISWEGSEGDQNTLMGMNIRKHNKRELELSINTIDADLNHTGMTVYYFEREK